MEKPLTDYLNHKVIPDIIRPQVIKALSFFPELKDEHIIFKFKKSIKKSTMQAQPALSGLFKKKNNRKYIIMISEKFHIEEDTFNIMDVADNIVVGWLGHELGHIMDYRNRSALGMVVFAFRYLFSQKHITEVERTADTFAVQHGMGDYILETKNFILNHSAISPAYKARIRRLYLSPEEIMEMVNKLKKKKIRKEIDKEVEKQHY